MSGATVPGCGPDLTPQGFLVERDESGTWTSVLVARTGLAPGGTDLRLLGFGAPGPEVVEMLQASDLFAVIADPGPLGAQAGGGFGDGIPTFANRLWLGPWPLRIAVGEAGGEEPSDVLLLKYRDGTLRDLVASRDLWAGPARLDDEAAASLSEWMTLYLDSACRRAADDDLYRPFADLVSDPYWKGFVVLRPTIDLGAFPGELAAFPSWLGSPDIHAHHAGAEVGDVRYPSIFGVVDRQDKAAGGGGGLSLASLRARVQYGAPMSVELRIAATPAGLEDAPIPMSGDFAIAGGRRVYTFETSAGSTALDRPGEAPLPLEDWLGRLGPMLTGWLGHVGNEAGTLELRLGYEHPVAPGGDVMATIPVLATGPIPVADADRALAAAGREGADWLARTAPERAGARFSLEASIRSDPAADGLTRVTLPAFTVAAERVREADAATPSE